MFSVVGCLEALLVGSGFLGPLMSLDEMKTLMVEKLRERGFPRFVASFFASGLGRLKRWK